MRRLVVAALVISSVFARGQERIRDVIYLKQGGCAFTMDVFKPKIANHKAVVWMVSGGWFSNHDSINADLAKAYTDRGFTVFEVVHGSQPKFQIPEIVSQVRRAIRFVRSNATTYEIDPLAIGVSGGSAGGHLSLEIAGLGDDGNPGSADVVERSSSRVNAVVAYYPPTDFLNWGKEGMTPFHIPVMAVFLPAFGVTAQTPEATITKLGHDLSPITYVNPSYPPTLLVHGDADPLVPVQQSKLMDAALESGHIVHKLIIVPGGGHDGATIMKTLVQSIDWFDANLKVKN